ncbi:MAG: hypothetical protein GC137_02140 [Alphaproteobacteria bacterium]|nr:hypothetical protein [Alphaproteobacteria bacterium]
MSQDSERHRVDSRAYAQIGIVGYGAVGQAVLAQQVDILEALVLDAKADPERDLPHVEFTIWNDGPDIAVGNAYDLQSHLFLLNFPVQAKPKYMGVAEDGGLVEMRTMTGMHLRQGHVNELKDWLNARKEAIDDDFAAIIESLYQKKFAECGGNIEHVAHEHPLIFRDYMLSRRDGGAWNEMSYLPRGFYREFLLDKFQETRDRIAALNQQVGHEIIKINTPEDCLVTDILILNDGGRLTVCKNGHDVQVEADSLVIATGHHHSNLIDEENRRRPSFADTPLHDNEMKNALGEYLGEEDSVFIMGMGASFVDAVRALKALDFRGKIITFAGSPLEFWPMDRTKDDNTYSNTDGFITKISGLNGNLKGIKDAVINEVYCELCIETGPQNFFWELACRDEEIKRNLDAESYQAYAKTLASANGRWTAPDSCRVIAELTQRGQIEYVASRIDRPEFDEGTQTWNLYLANGEVRTGAKAVVDCAGLATKVVGRDGHIADPLIRQMAENKLVKICPEIGLAVSEVGDRIVFAGPAGTNSRAIPYTRALFEKAAKPSLIIALEAANQRMIVSKSSIQQNPQTDPSLTPG